jgi:uncharacterized protein YegP (UPF0339 family)
MPYLRIYIDRAGEYRWQRRANNHKVIAEGGEGYKNRQDCIDMAIEQFQDDTYIVNDTINPTGGVDSTDVASSDNDSPPSDADPGDETPGDETP